METGLMDTEALDTVLMLHGESRHCSDCGTATVFLPVDAHLAEWVCTACDAAVLLAPLTTAA